MLSIVVDACRCYTGNLRIYLCQGLLDSDTAMAVALQAIDYSRPEEASLACDLFMAVQQPSEGLQKSFFGGLCSQGSPLLALNQLQQSPELASQGQSCYVMLLLRLSLGEVSCSLEKHADGPSPVMLL